MNEIFLWRVSSTSRSGFSYEDVSLLAARYECRALLVSFVFRILLKPQALAWSNVVIVQIPKRISLGGACFPRLFEIGEKFY